VTWAKCLQGDLEGHYFFVDARIERFPVKAAAAEVVRQYVGRGGLPAMPSCEAAYLENKTAQSDSAMAVVIKDKAAMENVISFNLYQVVPKSFGDKRQRALRVQHLGLEGKLWIPKFMTPDQKKVIDEMCMFTGKAERNMDAVDDGHDATVWVLLMMLDVKRPHSEQVWFTDGETKAADFVEAVWA
jgi:hypothetical protein